MVHAQSHEYLCAQVDVVVGPASESLERLAARGVRFDLAFLDADKGGYLGYYRQAWLRGFQGIGLNSIPVCCARHVWAGET